MASGGHREDPARSLPTGGPATGHEASPSTPSRAAWPRLAALALGGLCVQAPFVWPATWPLAWVGLIPLLVAAPGARSVRRAAFEGWWMGLWVVFPAFIWLIDTIHVFGGFPQPVAVLFYAALTAYGALQFALVGAALRWAGPGAPALLAPALLVAAEFLYPNLFPWRVGHSQRELPLLLQIGDLAGPYGTTFVIAYLASGLARCRTRPMALLVPVALVLATLGYGTWRIAQVEAILSARPLRRVGVVQGNVGLHEKRHRELFGANVQRYQELSRGLLPTADVIVWPETVVEWGIPRHEPFEARHDPMPGAPVPLIFGAVSYEPRLGGLGWFNSAFLRMPDGNLSGTYDKIILMPFGEYLPFADTFPWIKSLSPNTGDFQAGAGPAVLSIDPELRVGPLICYEDLLAGLTRRTVGAGATVLLTIANLAWYGDSPALLQHESLALWRAVENRRYLVISTNTGLTSLIDPLGRVVESLPVQQRAAGIFELRPLEVATPYSRLGDVFAWSCVAASLALLLWCRARPYRAAMQGRAGGTGQRAAG